MSTRKREDLLVVSGLVFRGWQFCTDGRTDQLLGRKEMGGATVSSARQGYRLLLLGRAVTSKEGLVWYRYVQQASASYAPRA